MSRSVRVLGVVAGLLLGAAVACGGGGGGGGGAGGDDGGGGGDRAGESGGGGGDGGHAAARPSCDDRTLGSRRYVLCTAGDRPDQGLVVALHGRGSTADEMRAGTELDRQAAGAGLAVVYPDSLDGGWGDDTFTSPSRPSGDEDVAFLDALTRELRAAPEIGDGPIGLVGFSNGGSMALRYASERPGDVRAVVAVAGQLPRDEAVRPTGRVPVMVVYGAADPVRSYGSGIPSVPGRRPGDPTPTLPTPDTVAAFVARSAGSAEHEGPEETDPDPADGTRLRTERWTDRDGTLAVLHTIVGGGHTWPSARRPFTTSTDFGATSHDLDATAEAVTFLVSNSGG